jgi:hypothetical protein
MRAIKRLMVSEKGQRNLILTPKANAILEDDSAVILADGWWLSSEGVKDNVRISLLGKRRAAELRDMQFDI